MSNIKDADEKKLEEMTLEETFEGIDEIMEKLSDNDLPLEESINLYKKGMEMLGHCRGVIEEVEGKLVKLSSDFNDDDNQ